MGTSYRDLKAWQKAMRLALSVYRSSESFPRKEMFGLTAQLRRCAISVPSNIAEGQGRLTKREFRTFLGHARGSLMELETQLILARELEYLDPKSSTDMLARSAEVGKIINGLMYAILPPDKD